MPSRKSPDSSEQHPDVRSRSPTKQPSETGSTDSENLEKPIRPPREFKTQEEHPKDQAKGLNMKNPKATRWDNLDDSGEEDEDNFASGHGVDRLMLNVTFRDDPTDSYHDTLVFEFKTTKEVKYVAHNVAKYQEQLEEEALRRLYRKILGRPVYAERLADSRKIIQQGHIISNLSFRGRRTLTRLTAEWAKHNEDDVALFYYPGIGNLMIGDLKIASLKPKMGEANDISGHLMLKEMSHFVERGRIYQAKDKLGARIASFPTDFNEDIAEGDIDLEKYLTLMTEPEMTMESRRSPTPRFRSFRGTRSGPGTRWGQAQGRRT